MLSHDAWLPDNHDVVEKTRNLIRAEKADAREAERTAKEHRANSAPIKVLIVVPNRTPEEQKNAETLEMGKCHEMGLDMKPMDAGLADTVGEYTRWARLVPIDRGYPFQGARVWTKKLTELDEELDIHIYKGTSCDMIVFEDPGIKRAQLYLLICTLMVSPEDPSESVVPTERVGAKHAPAPAPPAPRPVAALVHAPVRSLR